MEPNHRRNREITYQSGRKKKVILGTPGKEAVPEAGEHHPSAAAPASRWTAWLWSGPACRISPKLLQAGVLLLPLFLFAMSLWLVYCLAQVS